jgi:hypothetical protein
MKLDSLFHSQMIPFLFSVFILIALGDISYILPVSLIYIISSLLIYVVYESVLIDSKDEMERIRQQYVNNEIEVTEGKET